MNTIAECPTINTIVQKYTKLFLMTGGFAFQEQHVN